MIAELNLMPWMIVWALVTTVVLILAFYQLKVVSHESPGIHVLEKPSRIVAMSFCEPRSW